MFHDVRHTVDTGAGAKKKDVVQSRYYTAFVVGGVNVNRHQLGMILEGQTELGGEGLCPSVTLSNTKPNRTDYVCDLGYPRLQAGDRRLPYL